VETAVENVGTSVEKRRIVSDAVRNLEVDKAEFDAALKKLIATPPIRKATIAKRRPWEGTTTAHPSRKPYQP
jgi:hypothetical protein